MTLFSNIVTPSGVLTPDNFDSFAQPLDADLTAIAALAGTSGLLKKTAENTWSLDTTAYTTNTGTVTSVGGTGTVSGLSLSGTVTTSGNITLSGTLSVTPSNFASQTANTFLAAPNGSAGVPTFRALVAADVPTLNQNTTGSAATLTTARTLTIGNTGKTFNGSANVSWSLAEIGAQATLVSGTNIKTINSTSILGSGNITISGGATGGGTNKIFWENDQIVTSNYSITSNKNAMSAGTITIASGVTVTVPSGSKWTVVG